MKLQRYIFLFALPICLFTLVAQPPSSDLRSENLEPVPEVTAEQVTQATVPVSTPQQLRQQKALAAREKAEKSLREEAPPIVPAPTAADISSHEFLADFKELHVDYDAKRTAIIKLVKSAINYLLTHREEEAFKAILYDRQFVLGETELLVIDTNGLVYAHSNPAETWSSVWNQENDEGVKVTQLIIDTAKQGGGWINYAWKGHYKSTYAELIEKNGKQYVIAGGFYPSTKKTEVEALIASAVAEFQKHGREDAFSEFDNKVGKFVKGNLYIVAYDMKGYCVAHGDNTDFVGRNFLDMKDDEGKFIVREMLKAAADGKHWVSYQMQGSKKETYVQQVADKDGNKFVISCSYYPNDNTELVVSIVKRAVKDFNARGRRTVIDRFNYNPDFHIGDLTVFMYSFNGKVLADGEDPNRVGENQFQDRSITGEYVMREIIAKAKAGGGWIEHDSKGGWKVSYVEKVTDKQGSYVIGCGYYPYGARERTLRLVKRAAEYLRSHPNHEAFREFGSEKSSFIKGDLEVFVFNPLGDCLAYGWDYDLIFRNFKNYKDSAGKPVFDTFMTTIREDGKGWIQYKSRNTTKMVYIEKVEKGKEWFMVGSGYYK